MLASDTWGTRVRVLELRQFLDGLDKFFELDAFFEKEQTTPESFKISSDSDSELLKSKMSLGGVAEASNFCLFRSGDLGSSVLSIFF